MEVAREILDHAMAWRTAMTPAALKLGDPPRREGDECPSPSSAPTPVRFCDGDLALVCSWVSSLGVIPPPSRTIALLPSFSRHKSPTVPPVDRSYLYREEPTQLVVCQPWQRFRGPGEANPVSFISTGSTRVEYPSEKKYVTKETGGDAFC